MDLNPNKGGIILPGIPPIENGDIPSQVVRPGDFIYQDTDLLAYRGILWPVAMLDMDMREDEIEQYRAYLYGEYFYVYIGKWGNASMNNQVGIYWDDVTRSIVRLDPITDQEKEEHLIYGKLLRSDVNSIAALANANALHIDNIPESSKAFLPAPKSTDDILKRLIKLAIAKKGIALDDYRDNFVDKNALFNFKQVLKGDSRLSMLLFDRGTNALNLKYSIILEEKDPNHPLGKPVDRIVVTSEDTFDM